MPTEAKSPPVRARLKDSGRIFDEKLAEISPRMRPEEAALEANRCLYCYDAPCIAACPTHIDIPRFIKQIASKNTLGSAKTILEANALGHSCARVCPVEVLCEGSCVYHDWQEKPIAIARLQRYATDHYFYSAKARAFSPGPDNRRPVAVVGAGPAGLSCAFYLRRLGHPVTLFERRRVGGGLNSFGIAEYKMTQKTALEEVRRILDLGVDLRSGVSVGKDVSFAELTRKFEAVFIGVGLGATRSLGVPGEDLPGVVDALGFIEHIKNRSSAALTPGKTTVVIGAGNTAIDAVTQAKRLGTPRVVMAYRRAQRDMSAYDFEFALAKQDEVEFLWHAAPKRVLGKDSVTGIEFLWTKLQGGKLLEVPGSEFTVPCDRVIKAIGQSKPSALAQAAGLKTDDAGRIWVDPKTLRTSNARFWAGGDAVNGGKEVVNAAADGKRAAWHIHKALLGAHAPPAGSEYWVSTIDGRKVAPIPERSA